MTEAGERQEMLQRARLAVQTGRPGDARRILAALLRQNPADAAAWVWLGKAVDDAAKREECFRRALRCDPENDEARRGLIALRSGPSIDDQAGAGGSPDRILAHPSRCRQCGAHLRYDVTAAALRCAHCGAKHKPPRAELAAVWSAMPRDLSVSEVQTEPTGQRSLRCYSCGATTGLSLRTASLACPFCGSPQVVRTEEVTPLIPPQAIVPFHVDRQEAGQALRSWLGGGWWTPGDLPRRAEVVDLHGVYLPFWAFKGLAEVSYHLSNGRPEGGPRSQQQHIPVKDVLLSASYSLEADLLEAIEPFHLEEALQFHPQYLAGWPAEVYQVALADATIQARERMSEEAQMMADVWAPVEEFSGFDWGGGGDVGALSGQKQHRQGAGYQANFCTVHIDSFQHLLLPVWVGSYRYRGRLYAFAVNGQTGKAGGESPRSAGMVGLSVATGVAVVALLGMLGVRLFPVVRSWFTDSESTGPEVEETLTKLVLLSILVLGPLLVKLLFRWPKIRRWLRSLAGGVEED